MIQSPKEGMLVVISAPSGTGKGTVRKTFMKEHPEVVFCPSTTTRRPREGEVDGVDYFFVEVATFKSLIQEGRFMEWALVYGNYYGTPREPVEKNLSEGRIVLLEKDVQGAVSLKHIFPDGVYIFIMPPSLDELVRRIELRGTETPEERQMRVESARMEFRYLGMYDYIIVNDQVEQAVRRFEAVVVAESLRRCFPEKEWWHKPVKE